MNGNYFVTKILGSLRNFLLFLAIIALFFVTGVGIAWLIVGNMDEGASVVPANATLPATGDETISNSLAQKLTVNAQLQVNGQFYLAPSSLPADAKAGTIVFDEATSTLQYFNGQGFVALTENQGTTAVAGLQGVTGQSGQINVLTANGIANLSLPQSIDTAASPVFNGLTLSNALGIASGGTGGTSFTANSLLIGNGTGAFGEVTAGGAGLCLVSTAGAPTFAACSGGASVASLNGLTGALTLANASGVGTTITINDASTAQKGIAQFNATNFSVAAGTVNTIQNIATTSSPTFAGLTLSSPLTVANGGTGRSTLTLNSVIVGNGAGIVQQVTAGGAGECLVSTAGAPVFTTCPGSGGVTSIDGLTGVVTVNNATGSGSAITIDDASNAQKGIASFNSTNFSVSGGAVNTIQGIATTSTPTFAGLTLTGLLTANGGLTVEVGDTFIFNGDAFTDLTGTGLIISGGTLQAALGTSVDLTTEVTGTLPIGSGGTNATTAQAAINNLAGLTTNGDILYHNGTNTTRLARGSDTQCLLSNATTIVWGTCTGDGVGMTSLILAGTSGTPQTLNDGNTITIAAGTNITTTAGVTDTVTVAVVNNPTFSGLVTAQAGITVTAGQIFTFNTDAFTDLTGTGLTISSGSLQSTLGTSVDLTAEVTGTLPIANGGTNAVTSQDAINNLSQLTTNGDILYYNGTNSTRLARGSDTQCLLSNATTIVWGTCTGDGVGMTSFTIAGTSGTPQTITDSNTLTIAAGTNVTTTASATDTLTVAVVNNPTFSGLVTANGGLTVETGDTFTFNGDAFTDLSGDGLQVDTGVLEVDSTVCRTTGNCAGVGGTGDILNNGQNGTVRIGSNNANSTILESNNVDRLTIDSTGASTFSGTLTVTGLTTLNGGLTVEAGDTFTFNTDAFDDLTGSGLVISSGDLTVDATSAIGFFRNGGNAFTANSTLGNTGNFDLNFMTNNLTRATLQADGDFVFDTDTFMIDAASNRVGVGVTSAAALFSVGTGSTSNFQVDSTGNTRTAGYLRVGSTTAPVATSAGNLTVDSYLAVGVNAASSATGRALRVHYTNTNTAVGADSMTYYRNYIQPTSNSSTEHRAIEFQNYLDAASGITHNIVQGGYFENRFIGDGLVATSTGILSVGMVADSTSAATVQATFSKAYEGRVWLRPSGTTTGTITNGIGFDANLVVSPGLTATNLYGFRMQDPAAVTATNVVGLEIEALTQGSNIYGIRSQIASGANKYNLYIAGTAANYLAGTVTVDGLTTLNGGLTVEAGDTFTFNGDAFDDLTGTGLTISSGDLQTTLGTSVDLTSEVTGVLPIANGGTNAATAQAAINNLAGLTTDGDLLYHNGTNATRLARGANGECLTSNATTILWGSCAGTGTTFFTLAGTSGTSQSINGGDTVTIAAGTNITTTAGATDTVTVAVVNNPTFSGLVTANGGLTVEAGDTFTFNTDGFTDFTGGGLVNSSGVLTVDATTATGFFRNGGNSFGGTATLGTNDANSLVLETANTAALTIDTSQNAGFAANLSNVGTVSLLTGSRTIDTTWVFEDMVAVGSGATLTLDNQGQYRGIVFNPTVIYDDASVFTGGRSIEESSILKNPNGVALGMPHQTGFYAASTIQGDGALFTTDRSAFLDPGNYTTINSGTVQGNHVSYGSALSAGAGVTITDRRAVEIEDAAGAGSVTDQYGLYVANLTKGTNDYGLYIQGADTYALFVDSGISRLDGNLVVDTDTLFVDSSTNRVGVGDATPETVLHVKAADPILTVQDTEFGLSSAQSLIRFAESDGSGNVENYWDAGGADGTASFFFRVQSNSGAAANALTISHTNGHISLGSEPTDARLALSGGASVAAWGTNGVQLRAVSTTFTDTSTAASGSATNAVINSFGRPTLAATNSSVTTTNAATVYIQNSPLAGTNQTITNAYSLWVDDGAVRLDGALTVEGDSTFNGNTTIGNANSDTLTINAGTSGTGIILSDSSFANCGSLTTVSNVLTCGSGGGSLFTDGGNVSYLTSLTDQLSIGDSADYNGKLQVVNDDTADYTLLVRNAASQTAATIMAQNSDGTELFRLTGSVQNLYLGREAGVTVSTGAANTAVGYNALHNNNTANENVAFGAAAGFSITGAQNTAIGTYSQQNGGGGTRNVSLGYQALFAVTGSQNTAIGALAGDSLTTGADGNVLLGYQAGENITTGDNNIVIGYDLDAATATGSNQLNIAGLLHSTDYTADVLVLGDGVTSATPDAARLQGTSGSGTDIAGASLTIASGQGTGTGVSGNIIFQYAPAGSTGASLNTLQTACSISGTNGSLSCPGAGTNSERFGLNSTAAGNGSTALGNNATAGGQDSVALGRDALTNSGYEIAIGYASTTTGSGSNSIAIGAFASSDGGIAIGTSSSTLGEGVAIGGDVTAFGGVALGSISEANGWYSTALGRSAVADFDYSIALGSFAETTAAGQLVSSAAEAYLGLVQYATPVAASLNAGGGLGTDIAGASLSLNGGRGTGTGAGGAVLIQTAPAAGSTGSSLNNLVTRLTIEQGGNILVGASDTTGSLLVLDTKTGSGDPTGVNGGMYYNSNAGKLRCYENSTWKDCITSPGGLFTDASGYSYLTDTAESLVIGSSSATTPTSKLGIVGTSNQTQLYIQAHSGQSSANPIILIEDSAGAELIRLHSPEDNSVFLGHQAGGQISSGVANVGIGWYSLQQVTTGQENTAMGNGAGYSISGNGNTVFGAYAMQNGTGAGHYNTAIGTNALYSTTGGNNIGLGFQAGDNITSGSNNIVIGAGQDAASATGSNQLNIAGLIHSTDYTSDVLVVGDGVTSATPDNATIQGTSGSGSNIAGASLTIAGGQGTGTGVGGSIILQTAPAGSTGSSLNALVTRLEVQADGDIAMDTTTLFVDAVNNRVGVGTASPGGELHVASAGDAEFILEGDTGNSGASENFNPVLRFKQDGGSTRMDIGLVGDAGQLYTGSLANAAYVLATSGVDFQLGNSNVGAVLTILNSGATTLSANTTLGDAVTDNLTVTAAIQGTNGLIFDGATDNTFETTLAITDPGADFTVTLPAQTGTLVLDTTLTTEGDIYYRNGSGLTRLARGANGECLTANATTILWGSCGSGSSKFTDAGAQTYLTATADELSVGGSGTSVGAKLSVIGDADEEQLLVRANATQSNTNPLILAQASDGSELFRLSTTDTGSLFLGLGAGTSDDGGNNNTGIGQNALDSITSGQNNTALGKNALTGASTSSNNTALGAYALISSSVGSNNIAIGYAALQDATGGNNVGIGMFSMITNTGNDNVALGNSTIFGTGNASANVALGHTSLGALTDGDNNIAIGAMAGDNLTTGSSNIIIGYNLDAASATGNNQLNIAGLLQSTDYTTGDLIVQGDDAADTPSLTVGTTDQDGSLRIADGTTHYGTIQVAALGSDEIYILPDSDGSDTVCLVDLANCGGSGANTALSNLASVAINTSLLPASDDAIDLGDNTHRWRDLYLGGESLHIGTSTSDEGLIQYTTSSNVLSIQSTGNIAIGTSNTTGTQFILDDKTDTGDPGTGVNGGMYYNSNLGKFRCYENSAWKDCITTAGLSALGNTEGFTDSTTESLTDAAVDLWDGTYANITLNSTNDAVMVSVVVYGVSDGNDDETNAFTIHRAIGSNPTCASTQVGSVFSGGFTTSASVPWTASVTFRDTPASTSNVRYTVCSHTDSDGTVSNDTTTITFSLLQAGN